MSTPPPVLGKYQLIRKLAAGGMAEVYLARAAGPMGFEKQVVVKRILPHLADEENFVTMFLGEARLAAQLNHPNVVQVFDFGEADGTFFLVMEFIDGVNLRALFRKAFEAGAPLDFAVAAKIVSLACEGLGFAHDFVDPQTGEPMHLVHRDVSPDNILIARNGSVKVVDFGIAKAANQTHLTKTGTVKGKFAYMPPEQLSAQPLDKRADVFALGVVLHELVTGKKPFDTSNEAAIVRGIMYEPPLRASTVRPDMPEALQAIIDKALAKDRDERYGDCRALQSDLERFIVSHGAPVSQYQLAQVVQKLAPPPPQPPAPVPTPTGPNGPPMGVPPTAATVPAGDDVDLSTSILATPPPPADSVLVLTPKPRRAPAEPPPPPVPSAVAPAPPLPTGVAAMPPWPSPAAPQGPPTPGAAQVRAQGPGPHPAAGPSLAPSSPHALPHAPYASSPSGPYDASAPEPPPSQAGWGQQTHGWQVAPPGQAWSGQPVVPQAAWGPSQGFGAAPLHPAHGPAASPPRPKAPSRVPVVIVLLVAIGAGSAGTWFVLKRRAVGAEAGPGVAPVAVAPSVAPAAAPSPEPTDAPPAVTAPVAAPPTELPPAQPPPAEPPPAQPVAGRPADPEPPPAERLPAPEPAPTGPVKPKVIAKRAGGQRPAPPQSAPAPPEAPATAAPPEVRPAVAETASVEFRVRPFGAVWVDGKFLGETPFAPATMAVGNHQVKIVNRDLGREVTRSYDVKPGSNVFRFSFDE